MSLICSKCDSHYLIEDYDQRLHYITGYHCGMCGSTKLIEDKGSGIQGAKDSSEFRSNPRTQEPSNPISKEVPMSHLLCEAPGGCKKQVVRDRLCTLHYRAKHGISPKAVPSTKKPPLTPAQIAASKICSVKNCGRKKLANGLCYKHLTEKHGGVNPYKYPKKGKYAIASQGTGKPTSSAFVEVAPNVLVPKETKVLVDQINAIQSFATGSSLSMISRKETITMKVPGEEGGLREAGITFTYRNGSTPEFNWASVEGVTEPLTFDDWMFLGSIASEIKRIAGEV